MVGCCGNGTDGIAGVVTGGGNAVAEFGNDDPVGNMFGNACISCRGVAEFASGFIGALIGWPLPRFRGELSKFDCVVAIGAPVLGSYGLSLGFADVGSPGCAAGEPIRVCELLIGGRFGCGKLFVELDDPPPNFGAGVGVGGVMTRVPGPFGDVQPVLKTNAAPANNPTQLVRAMVCLLATNQANNSGGP